MDEAGNEVTKCFSSENEFFGTEGLRTNQQATFAIESLEPCTCLALPYPIVHEFLESSVANFRFVNHFFAAEITRLEERNRLLMMCTGEERYHFFKEENPAIVSRLPLKIIASYIDLHPGSLSRIRKNNLT